MLCATAMLDISSNDLGSRIANSIYNSCRAGQIQLHGFPDFSPTLTALKSGVSEKVEKTYKTCNVVGDKLAILQVYAQKWLDEELTRESATNMIKEHNAKFNVDGYFLHGERSIPGFNGLTIMSKQYALATNLSNILFPLG